MNLLAHVLVHVDASERSVARVRFARALAAAQGAAVTAVYGVMPASLAVNASMMDGGATMPVLLDLDAEQCRRARQRVADASADPGPAVAWLGDETVSPYRVMVHAAWAADLLVMSPQDAADPTAGLVPADLLGSTVVHAGRPVLVLPVGAEADAPHVPNRLLLAWKPTREAARALSATLPWLAGLDRIDLVAEPANGIGEPAWPGPAALEHWLRAHGFAGALTLHRLGAHAEAEAGERLQELAVAVGAQWMAMGCYGHSRAREWLFGGATRTVLRRPRLPVLMVH
jgi:nucleotide-binding universal stress UspA family protein